MKMRFLTIGLCVLLCTTMLGAACSGPGCNAKSLTIGGSAAGALAGSAAGSATISLGSGDAVTSNNTTAGNITNNETAPTVNNTTGSTVVGNSTMSNTVSNVSSTDPTYQQVVDFLLNDTTNTAVYQPSVYESKSFAETLADNGAKANLNFSIVKAEYTQCGGKVTKYRYVDKITTSDQGEKIFDCCGTIAGDGVDKEVTQLQVGAPFTEQALGNCTQAFNRGDNVLSITDVPKEG